LGEEIGAASFSQFRFAKCENDAAPCLFTSGIRGFAAKDFIWGCVKSLLPPAAAKFYFERRVIFTISRSEIVKMTRRSIHNLHVGCKKVFFGR